MLFTVPAVAVQCSMPATLIASNLGVSSCEQEYNTTDNSQWENTSASFTNLMTAVVRALYAVSELLGSLLTVQVDFMLVSSVVHSWYAVPTCKYATSYFLRWHCYEWLQHCSLWLQLLLVYYEQVLTDSLVMVICIVRIVQCCCVVSSVYHGLLVARISISAIIIVYTVS